MLEILQYPFMQRALIAGLVLAAILAVLGIFTILKKMSFFADGIAHASLAGVAIGIIFSWYPLASALVLSIVFALIIYFLEKKFRLSSDITIGIIFTSGMALGILLISLQPGYQPELISFLFGNILAIKNSDMFIIGGMALAIFAFIFIYFKQMTLLALDEELAYTSGVKTKILEPVFYVILAASVVLGIKILGIILVSALLILPTATAKTLSSSFKSLILSSVLFAEIIVLVGIYISFVFDLPTGPVIVLSGSGLFLLSAIARGITKKS
ncbi:metal ABC transporter permease [Patescibacteria group bacterium]|nr:metal ABC transporter permease [Patescibacteria group bacterium]